MVDSIDELDPNNYILALVQIPSGQNSETLLDSSNPDLIKFLKKYFKRICKKPNTSFSRSLPMEISKTKVLNLAMKESQPSFIPYVGQAKDSSWYLRQLPTYKFVIESCGYQNDNEIINIADSPVINRKRRNTEQLPSPQLVISSDDES